MKHDNKEFFLNTIFFTSKNTQKKHEEKKLRVQSLHTKKVFWNTCLNNDNARTGIKPPMKFSVYNTELEDSSWNTIYGIQ